MRGGGHRSAAPREFRYPKLRCWMVVLAKNAVGRGLVDGGTSFAAMFVLVRIGSPRENSNMDRGGRQRSSRSTTTEPKYARSDTGPRIVFIELSGHQKQRTTANRSWDLDLQAPLMRSSACLQSYKQSRDQHHPHMLVIMAITIPNSVFLMTRRATQLDASGFPAEQKDFGKSKRSRYLKTNLVITNSSTYTNTK